MRTLGTSWFRLQTSLICSARRHASALSAGRRVNMTPWFELALTSNSDTRPSRSTRPSLGAGWSPARVPAPYMRSEPTISG